MLAPFLLFFLILRNFLIAGCEGEGSRLCQSRDSPSLFVLSSMAVPETSWQEMSSQLEKIGGAFVLKGMPEDSFLAFAKRLVRFREIGINAPIFIDPGKFEALSIKTVPVIVLEGESQTDHVTGNVSLVFALEEVARKGANKTLANELLFQLKSQDTISKKPEETPSFLPNGCPFKKVFFEKNESVCR